MPLPKKIDELPTNESMAELRLAPPQRKRSEEDHIPRVGEFYADYSPLTPEEIAEVDAECADLFKRSRPLSR